MNVDAYLNRINHRGSTKPTAETLGALHRAHLLTVPFENLDIHIKRRIVLNEAALYDKIVLKKRGGFCFELNGLFANLLREMGFRVTTFGAAVTTKDGERGQGIDHLTLLVELNERWLVDVGFGDAFRLPLRLDDDGEQFGSLDHSYRITRADGRWILWSRAESGAWNEDYAFRIDALELRDFQEVCDYLQFSPESHFTQQRICSRATTEGKISLSDDRLIVTRNGQREEFQLTGEAEFKQALREYFEIETG